MNLDIFTMFGTLRDAERLRRLAISNWKLEVDTLRQQPPYWKQT